MHAKHIVAVAMAWLAVCQAMSWGQSSGRSVVFILDCSQGMETPAVAADELREVKSAPFHHGIEALPSRMDLSRDALKSVLTTLSAGDQQAALWLFGHRLAWEEGDEPALVEQTEYLAQTQGFAVLAKLLPGDDVELACPMNRLEPRDLATLVARLDAVKPWGENPLYLAITRALDSLDRGASAADTRLVVITSGANRQWLARYQADKQSVLDALERRRVPVHIVALGDESGINGPVEDELREIAAASRGSYRAAEGSDELETLLEDACTASPRSPAEVVAAPFPEPAAAIERGLEAGTVAAPVAAQPQPQTVTIEGRVLFYRRGVRKARLRLEGSEIPAAITDAAGQFVLEGVRPGTYELECEAVVKNVIRTRTSKLTIEPGTASPVAFDVVLE